MQHHKVYFSDGKGNRTAGLILTGEQLAGKSTSDLSRLFPYSEAPKMVYLYVSPAFGSFEEAFEHKREE